MFNLSETAKISCHEPYEPFTTAGAIFREKRTELICAPNI